MSMLVKTQSGFLMHVNNLKLLPTFHEMTVILKKISCFTHAMSHLSRKLVYGVRSLLNSSVEANVINLQGQCKNKKTKELLCVYISNENLFIYSYKMCTQTSV